MSFRLARMAAAPRARQRADGSNGKRRHAVCVRLRHQLEPDRAPVRGGRCGRARAAHAPRAGDRPDVERGGRVARSAQPLRRQPGLGHVSQFDIALDGNAHARRPRIPSAPGRPRSPSPWRLTASTSTSSTRATSTVSTYGVDASGALTFASERRHRRRPDPGRARPDGASAYVTNFPSGTVSQYDVHAGGRADAQAARRRRGRLDAGGHRREPRRRERLRHQPGCPAARSRSSRSPRRRRAWRPGAARGRRRPAARHRGRRRPRLRGQHRRRTRSRSTPPTAQGR